jgi:hypothetical protein
MSEQHTPKPSRLAMTARSDTPFPRHWLYYIVLKYALLIIASAIALYVAYQFL